MRRPALKAGVVAVVVAIGCLALPAPAGAANPWIRVAAPNPGVVNILQSVSCSTETDCVAVGRWASLSGLAPLLIRTTDGVTWKRSTLAFPTRGLYGVELSSVSCTSPTACIAVGQAGERGADGMPYGVGVILRTEDGRNWQRKVLRGLGGPYQSGSLNDVSCAFDWHCTIVGRHGDSDEAPLILRTTDGSNWVRRTPAFPGRWAFLSAVHCVTALNCTAVGAFNPSGNTPSRTLVMRVSDGVHWRQVPSPNPAPSQSGSLLYDVSCVRGSLTCTAVGYVVPAPGPVQRAFVLRTTNSSSWTRAATPVASGEVALLGVSCLSITECTAVGSERFTNDTVRTVLLRTTDGTSWSSPSPVSQREGREPNAVSCPTPVKCTAVGWFDPAGEDPVPRRGALVLRET